MRAISWYWSTEEGKKSSNWIREDVTRAMLFKRDLEGPLGINDRQLGKNKLAKGKWEKGKTQEKYSEYL